MSTFAPTHEEREKLEHIRDAWDTVPTMDSTYMLYYDVESLNNLYTVSVYDPKSKGLILFYLFDDEEIAAQIDMDEAKKVILESNPYINREGEKHQIKPENILILDLKLNKNHQLLCRLLGLSMTDDVNMTPRRAPMPDGNPIEPLSRRLVHYSLLSDTHVDYDTMIDWIVVGYNSSEYDSSIMAKYFYASEAQARAFAAIEEENIKIRHRNAQQTDVTKHEQELDWTNQPDYIPTTAVEMRRYNDLLFSYEGRMSMMEERGSDISKIRLAMLNSGRHLDIALLNEKMKFVKLKRLCGMLGYQILESEKLSGPNATIDNIEEFYDLLAYNASDTINLYRLAHHPVYANAFDQKSALIHRYPECVFNNENRNGFNNGRGSEKPMIASDNVNAWRLRADSTSAQIVGKFLAPYTPLDDIDVVSFNYPSKIRLDQLNKERPTDQQLVQFNVLEKVKTMFFEKVSNERARSRVAEALSYYESIEGKNFNANDKHIENLKRRYSYEQLKEILVDGAAAYTFDDIPKPRLNVPYYRLDGSPTDCYVTFSTGGIHGAQVNTPWMNTKAKAERDRVERIARVQREYPDPNVLRTVCGKQPVLDQYGNPKLDDKGKPIPTKTNIRVDEEGNPVLDKNGKPKKWGTDFIVLSNGDVVAHKDVLKPGSTIKNGCEYREIEAIKPYSPFIEKEGQNKPNGEYAFTSIGKMVHQDFTSYYPSLLTNQSSFNNPVLGNDRYVMAYDEKNDLGRLKKEAKSINDMASFTRYDLQQKNMKLILNSASGAADAQTGKKIRLNNSVISMRLIGQMLTWILAQLEVFEGADMPSTNTDGIYAKADMALCKKVIDQVKDMILVEIEPEELLLVSKDSNNRLEMFFKKDVDMSHLTMDSIDSIGASGGTLACHSGPSPLNSLAHAAVVDYITMQYLGELALLQHNAEQAGTTPAVSITDEFNTGHAARFVDGLLGREIITPPTALPWTPAKPFDWLHALTMFQTMVVANGTSMSYPFALTTSEDGSSVVTSLPDVNRVFFVREDAKLPNRDIVHLVKANGATIPPARREKMAHEGSQPCHGALSTDPEESQMAYEILKTKGLRSPYAQYTPDEPRVLKTSSNAIGDDREVKITKIPGIDPELNVVIVNEDIECMRPEDAHAILDALDVNVYLDMARSTFEGSWRNKI